MRDAGTTVRHLLVRSDFRRLLLTRLTAQSGDGVLQAALAGTLLFNPQRAADPLDVAAGFAVLLLPYSLVGPFAGVWLDRWSRRQVLLRANLVRSALVGLLAVLVWGGVSGLPFLLIGLAVFSVSRFLLSALSASLPHTTDEPSLVPANALSTTSGAVATVVGGAVAVALLPLAGAGDGAYAVMTLAAALPYLASARAAGGFDRRYLGPDSATRAASLSMRAVGAGMVAGARHAWARPPAVVALAVITAHRLCFGLVTLMTLLLFRNTLDAWGPVPGGLGGLGVVVAAGAGGTLLAAAVTPAAVRRLGRSRWVTLLLAVAGPLLVALGLPALAPTVVLAGLVLGFVGQGVKICVDATLQESVEDDFRGRVFSVYDTLVNVSYVVALVAAAFLLPASGVSAALVVTVGAVYALTAVLSGVPQAKFPAR
ncbi:MFS transporter [Geodermatophilus sabuli]|uniref:Major Facilitator Superfamily protein n=1 Tax=Geodermatophilus sabuli TaxID=1564158 RepID=A0A285EEW1_9ACTN|nr:MFS transporter [Geodermatophilus sabuli]MBB3086243.1 MFS family permease [Geodermatophilus sabuli]SNX97540.1 Major Facilitator Superfamily protein [Geodermatophilus sabuli]